MDRAISGRKRGVQFWFGDLRFFRDLSIVLAVALFVVFAGALYGRYSVHRCLVDYGDADYCHDHAGTAVDFLAIVFTDAVVLIGGAILAIRRWTLRFLTRRAGEQV
jgi:hypothetical protein